MSGSAGLYIARRRGPTEEGGGMHSKLARAHLRGISVGTSNCVTLLTRAVTVLLEILVEIAVVASLVNALIGWDGSPLDR